MNLVKGNKLPAIDEIITATNPLTVGDKSLISAARCNGALAHKSPQITGQGHSLYNFRGFSICVGINLYRFFNKDRHHIWIIY